MGIFIIRDTLGKTSGVNIFVPAGYHVPVPITNLLELSTPDWEAQIDWNSIEYPPTRESIKKAWDGWTEGKDLTYELRDRPDLAPPQPESQPDWNALKYSFLQNSGYSRITAQTSNQRTVSRLELAIADYASGVNPNYSLLKTFWDSIVDGLTLINKPTNPEISSWNAITLAAHMKFSFGSDGKMLLL